MAKIKSGWDYAFLATSKMCLNARNHEDLDDSIVCQVAEGKDLSTFSKDIFLQTHSTPKKISFLITNLFS